MSTHRILELAVCYLIEKSPRISLLEPPLPQPHGTMPMLEFIDSNGVTWRVWNTVPSTRTAVSGEFENGWLTFESPTSRKRLAPVPPNWDTATPDRLELMCRAAANVPRRTDMPAQDANARAQTAADREA